MKKTLTIVCFALVLAIVCVGLVACDNNTQTPDNGGHNEYESATYTVTFNVNSSDFKLENNVIKDVAAGSKISEPTDANGNKIKPYKKGYTFQYWSKDGKSAFNFDVDTINAPTTLTAVYTNNVYKHELNKANGGFYIDKKLVVTSNDGKLSYAIEDCDNGATVSSGATLDLTYATTSALACPTPKTGDKFLFWFYMKDGKPVQLSKIKADSDSTVNTLEKYATAGYLDIYAMFESTLPKVEVVFDDTDTTLSIPVNGKVNKDDVPSVDKTGYLFKNWYYVVEKEVDGENVKEELDFAFADDKTTGTSLYGACDLKDYFTPATITLYTRWTKQISIASVADYKNVYNTLRNGTDAEIKEILSADIKIADIDFAGETLEPLFDEEHVFSGTIDGGTYSDNKVTKCASIKNLTISNAEHLSLLGYVSGQVKNLDVAIKLAPKKVDGKYASKILLGGIATQNGGMIENCTVDLSLSALGENKLNAVVAGGVCAVNSGDSSVKNTGYITKCQVKISAFNFNGESLVLGYIAAQSNSAGTISQCTAQNVGRLDLTCADDNDASNGRSFAKIGGIVASNGGSIVSSQVTGIRVKPSSLEEFYFGGISAENTGSITKSSAVISELYAEVGGGVSSSVCIGGIVGKNEGYIYNAYCNINGMEVLALRDNAIIAIGGIVGANVSNKTDSSTSATSGVGAINSAYATGSILLDATYPRKSAVVAYVGGIAGRNSASKVGSCFTSVDIDVRNSEGGENNVDFLFGSIEKDAKPKTSSLVYTKQNKLVVNGTAFKEPTNDAQETKNVFEQGADALKAMNLTFDEEVWDVSAGKLPTLKDNN